MKSTVARGLIAVAGVYHLAFGLTALLAPADALAQIGQVGFGVALEVSPQLMMTARFAATYLLAFGGVCLVYASNPTRFRKLGIPIASLFALRGINRVIQFGALAELGMSSTRNLIGTVLLFGFAVIMLMPLFMSDETA